MCRDQDMVNPHTHANVMVLSHEGDMNSEETTWHPYWYAKVLSIFHIDVQHHGGICSDPKSQQMDLLWVHWYGHDTSIHSGWLAKRLPCLGFIDGIDIDTYGFLDPQKVIQGVHLIPAFQVQEQLGLTSPSFFVNM